MLSEQRINRKYLKNHLEYIAVVVVLCVSRPDEDQSCDRKYQSKYVLTKHILFFFHSGFCFCLYTTYCLNILKILTC